eukprot:TRINITY_DN2114_c0_g1_i1.p1 TRINITY_DN2114_c0_g1~~TRINITY_DN2114_c0_g1_i1.p1  ORF type:complete len:342 (+),score=89.21 TRINITY_DN2114_c0_g1_i1:341-1366(+)
MPSTIYLQKSDVLSLLSSGQNFQPQRKRKSRFFFLNSNKRTIYFILSTERSKMTERASNFATSILDSYDRATYQRNVSEVDAHDSHIVTDVTKFRIPHRVAAPSSPHDSLGSSDVDYIQARISSTSLHEEKLVKTNFVGPKPPVPKLKTPIKALSDADHAVASPEQREAVTDSSPNRSPSHDAVAPATSLDPVPFAVEVETISVVIKKPEAAIPKPPVPLLKSKPMPICEAEPAAGTPTILKVNQGIPKPPVPQLKKSLVCVETTSVAISITPTGKENSPFEAENVELKERLMRSEAEKAQLLSTIEDLNKRLQKYKKKVAKYKKGTKKTDQSKPKPKGEQ